MNVLIDNATSRATHYALHCLFEKRLGWNLYRPIGERWREKGFLRLKALQGYGGVFSVDEEYAHSDALGQIQCSDGIQYIPMELNYTQKAITFNKFLEMDIDVIVTTFYGHEESFHKLVKLHKPNAIFIRVITNIHEKPLGFCRNILLATYEPMPPDVNYIIFHPEHHEDYCFTPPTNHKTIKSFVHHFPSYPADLDTWNKCKSSLRDFTFKMHGKDGMDGVVPLSLMPQAMKDSAFVWHVKGHGGGGYVARQALACGRPCIIKKKYAVIHNTLAKELFVDSVNCIDLDLGVERGIELIREWSQPDRHVEVCKATAEKFKKDVNFAEEAEKIRTWINHLPKGV